MTEYQFIPTDPEDIVICLTRAYQDITGVTVRPAGPEKLFIQWLTEIFVHERVLANYVGSQNIPSRAVGDNLDALAELLFLGKRPKPQPATCTVRFHISEAKPSSVLIPAGTRVTDGNNSLVWATEEDVYIPIGETFADTHVRCQTLGVVGNGYTPGQISTIIDPYDSCTGVENLTESAGGTDTATDEEFYELLRASMDGYSCAGARGGYIYFAKQVSGEIADVVANSPGAGRVAIYVLMNDGTAAGDEIKAAVLAACNPDDRRPMTDLVLVADPEMVTYDISFTYYIKKDAVVSSTEVEGAVEAAVQEYVAWQCGKLGRDINPDELQARIREAGGIKRVVLTSPVFTPLRDGKTNGQVPQVAKIGTITITNGGFEDE